MREVAPGVIVVAQADCPAELGLGQEIELASDEEAGQLIKLPAEAGGGDDDPVQIHPHRSRVLGVQRITHTGIAFV